MKGNGWLLLFIIFVTTPVSLIAAWGCYINNDTDDAIWWLVGIVASFVLWQVFRWLCSAADRIVVEYR